MKVLQIEISFVSFILNTKAALHKKSAGQNGFCYRFVFIAEG